ncbi:hypothetical protein EVAR_65098_1 [Eumeta japonica]|uniref:Uncharacterized protein n=1 Tax=Eumeta variegata TaxID=151549 RepID=A0A4C1Z303_EUMVA|nr:hypothetical protein EVAR_65098_1 [Eumeta japonica]
MQDKSVLLTKLHLYEAQPIPTGYPISTQKNGNTLVTPLKLRVSIDDGDHPLSGGSRSHVSLGNTKKRKGGVKGRARDLLASYLTNRVQKIDVNNIRSSGSVVRMGEPQGSILDFILKWIWIHFNMKRGIKACRHYCIPRSYFR